MRHTDDPEARAAEHAAADAQYLNTERLAVAANLALFLTDQLGVQLHPHLIDGEWIIGMDIEQAQALYAAGRVSR